MHGTRRLEDFQIYTHTSTCTQLFRLYIHIYTYTYIHYIHIYTLLDFVKSPSIGRPRISRYFKSSGNLFARHLSAGAIVLTYKITILLRICRFRRSDNRRSFYVSDSTDEWTHGEAEEIYREYQQQDDQYTEILADTLGGPFSRTNKASHLPASLPPFSLS